MPNLSQVEHLKFFNKTADISSMEGLLLTPLGTGCQVQFLKAKFSNCVLCSKNQGDELNVKTVCNNSI